MTLAAPIPAPGPRAHPFTFTLRLDREGYEAMELDCVTEEAAIEAARAALRSQIDRRPLLAGPVHRGVVGVGAGSTIEAPDKVIWLGEWEWSAAEGWCWQSSD